MSPRTGDWVDVDGLIGILEECFNCPPLDSNKLKKWMFRIGGPKSNNGYTVIENEITRVIKIETWEK